MTTTNLYEEIIPLYDLQQRSNDEQIKYLQEYRKNFTNKEITDYWGKKESFIYALMSKIGMKRDYKKRQTSKSKAEITKPQKEVAKVVKETIETPLLPVVEEAPVKREGFVFIVNGKYSAGKLINRLEKISLILDDEDAEFEISLTIKEKI